jgi:hypothetical protein
VFAGGNDSTGNGTAAKPYLTLNKAVARARVGLTPEARTVMVAGTLSEANADMPRRNGALFTIADTGEAGITIAGKEGTNPKLAKLIQSGASFVHARILHLEPGTRVDLENITITGGESQNGAGIYADHAELTLDAGCEITGNTADAESGGYGGGGILAKESTLIMREGSSVSGNTAESLTGGGIFLQSSQFTMDGGEISGNTSQSGGAGLYLNEESTAVIKNNARITGNISTEGGGGGIGLSEASVLTLEDTLIEGNWAVSAGGIAVGNRSRLEMTGGTIRDNHTHNNNTGRGGGVGLWDYSVFNMSGGIIAENTTQTNAGGVYVTESAFTMSGDAAIVGNTAAGNSGGVLLYISSFTMKENSSISGNTALYAGGVYVWAGSSFTMEGGVIKGNSVSGNNNTSAGGGVYVHNTPGNTFIKKGGLIYGDTNMTHTAGTNENTASTGKGHAVYVAAPTSKQRNADAGPEINLYVASNSDNTVWTYHDTSPGGVGHTTANWQ